jgi:hypothetical protein
LVKEAASKDPTATLPYVLAHPVVDGFEQAG